jgi:hypothetical protein
MKKIINIAVLTIVALMAASCFNLEEKVYDRVNSEAFYQNENSVRSAVASIYYEMQAPYEHFYMLNEFPSDQLTWRCWNGGNWGYDEGEKFVLSTHTWTPEAKIINNAWTGSWKAIGLCNQLLYDLKDKTASDLSMTEEAFNEYIAEVRTLRAWSYYQVFELWGGIIPLNTKAASETAELPMSESKVKGSFEAGCQSIWDFLVTELDESVDALPKNLNTRANQAMNRMLKARLLLNSKLFTGVDKFSDCKTLCEDIIGGKYGTYSVESDYHKVYDIGNENSSEVVFAYLCTRTMTPDTARNFRVGPFIPSSNANDLFGYSDTRNGWNCVILVPSHDNSGTVLSEGGTDTGGVCFLDAPYNDKLGAIWERFDDRDIRKQAFHCDETGKWDGLALKGAQFKYGTTEPYIADADRIDEPLVYVDQLGTFKQTNDVKLETVMSPRWGETNSGYRLVRYPIFPDAVGKDYFDISQVEFRITEVIYMLAECELRLSGNSNRAKELVNSVRGRYFNDASKDAVNVPGPGFTAFDLDWMLSEWGKEFLSEGCRRRTDLRRFDKFTQGQWWFFGRAEDYPAKRDRKYEWYPLPASALRVNKGLEQNPNY